MAVDLGNMRKPYRAPQDIFDVSDLVRNWTIIYIIEIMLLLIQWEREKQTEDKQIQKDRHDKQTDSKTDIDRLTAGQKDKLTDGQIDQ